MFGPRFARHVARRYRRRGLSKAARRVVRTVEELGVEGATILEIGGGVGELQLELLRRGAARSVVVELVGSYEEEARALAAEAGVSDRLTRVIGNLAEDGSIAEPADVVVLHRVVCCYPDYERLLGAAADHARRAVVFSHPPDNLFARVMIGGDNVVSRVLGRQYRAFVHPPAAMLEVLRAHGLESTFQRPGAAWQIAGATR